ncbi:MAG: hypothetical protein IPL14_20635 [Nitrospira sp.]|nr:hypothetical protein [Nitrospira sp.]
MPPQLSKNIRDNVEHLSPAPPDLRQAATLTLTTDKQRFDVIRHGHLRTAMYPLPKEALSDEEIPALPLPGPVRGTVPPPAGLPEPDTSLRVMPKDGSSIMNSVDARSAAGIEGTFESKTADVCRPDQTA